MNTGDIVTDSRAEAWTLRSMLGAGVWGRSWLIEAADGRQRVLKMPYEANDLPAAAAERIPLMRACAQEQADILTQDAASEHGMMVALEDRITLPSGATALLLPLHPTTFARQLTSGVPLTEAIDVMLQVARALQAAKATHGNLRPSNILIGPAGRPVLSDIITPSMETLMVGADRADPQRQAWAPSNRIARDTWALCQGLYAASMLDESGAEEGSLPKAPASLDKVALADLRDRVERRLKREGANARFISRAAARIGTLLGRGLSREADPSPPYRFLKAADLAPRLAEVHALVDPSIESVGKLLLNSSAQGDIFQSPVPVGFSVSVAATEGVKDADDVVCGVRLTDLDSGERVPIEDAQFTVVRHASGRLRYAFNLPDVAPGRYRARVAFSIKDSGHDPAAAEGDFEVRPPAGYVPPVKESEPTPLEFPGGEVPLVPLAPLTPDEFDDEFDDEDAATVLMSRADILDGLDLDTDPEGDASDPGGEVIDAFPRPLAPTGIGTQVDPTPVPAPIAAPPPRPAPPPLMAVPTPPPSEPDEVPSVAPAVPSSVVPPTAPAPMPVGSEPAAWRATQEGEADFFAADVPLPGDGALPGLGGQDLGAASGGAFDDLRERVLNTVGGDSRILMGAVIGGCMLLVLITVGLLRACS